MALDEILFIPFPNDKSWTPLNLNKLQMTISNLTTLVGSPLEGWKTLWKVDKLLLFLQLFQKTGTADTKKRRACLGKGYRIQQSYSTLYAK